MLLTRKNPVPSRAPAAEVPTMVLATGLGLLALFSLISILLGSEDPRRPADPRDDILFWLRYGVR